MKGENSYGRKPVCEDEIRRCCNKLSIKTFCGFYLFEKVLVEKTEGERGWIIEKDKIFITSHSSVQSFSFSYKSRIWLMFDRRL